MSDSGAGRHGAGPRTRPGLGPVAGGQSRPGLVAGKVRTGSAEAGWRELEKETRGRRARGSAEESAFVAARELRRRPPRDGRAGP